MRTHLAALVCAGWVLALGACSGAIVPRPQEAGESIVYGYIDMADAPVNLQWVSIRQYAPPSDAPYWSAGVEQGTYWQWYLKPGSYAVDSFGGSGFNSNYTFNMPRQSRSLRLVIKKAGIYYLGAFKYKAIAPNLAQALEITPKQYRLDPVTKPSEAAVLQMLLEKVEDDRWKKRIRARLTADGTWQS